MQTTYGNIVFEPGIFFRLTTVITLVGGTIFLMWLENKFHQEVLEMEFH